MAKHKWHQETPVDQYVVITGALEGCISNISEGIAVAKSIAQAKDLAQQLKDLEYFIRRGSW